MGPDKDCYLSKNHKFGTRNQNLGVQNFDCGITKIVFTKAFPSTNFIIHREKLSAKELSFFSIYKPTVQFNNPTYLITYIYNILSTAF